MRQAHSERPRPRRPRTIQAALGLLVAGALITGGALPAVASDEGSAGNGATGSGGAANGSPAGTTGDPGSASTQVDAQLTPLTPTSAPAAVTESATPDAVGTNASVETDLDATSVWGIAREGLRVDASGFAPNATLTVAIDGEVAGQLAANASGAVAFAFTITADPGTYTLTIRGGATTASTTFRVVADATFYPADWRASFNPDMSASRDVVSLAELAAEPVIIDGWDFPDSNSRPGAMHVDLRIGGTVVDTLVTNTLGDIEAEIAGPLPVGTHQVTLVNPVGTASATLVVVPNTQGTKPRAGEYRGTTVQTHAGSNDLDDPEERPFHFDVDGAGRLTGLTGQFWWYCRGGHGSGFDDWSTTEFPATPITVDRPFEIHWEDVSMDYAISGIVRADGSASGTLYAYHGACGTNIQEFSTRLAGTNPPPAGLPTAQRVAGGDRYATSVATSRAAFPGTAPVVYLASGQSFPDGLAAGPAAAHQGGPVLLTPRDAAPASVLAEIRRLNPDRVVIVGGTPSVSANVARQVQAIDSTMQLRRLGGDNRYETSRLIAQYAFPNGAPAAFVATGLKFPDALAAGPAAALRGGPVILVRGSERTADAATLASLRGLGVTWVGIAGDANSVSSGIASGIDGAVRDVRRFAGADRYATAALIGGLFTDADTVLVASGLGFADALPGAAAAGAMDAPMVLSRTACMPASTLTALQRWQPDAVLLLGGTPTLSSAVASYTRC